jgi:hypothetical protein
MLMILMVQLKVIGEKQEVRLKAELTPSCARLRENGLVMVKTVSENLEGVEHHHRRKILYHLN